MQYHRELSRWGPRARFAFRYLQAARAATHVKPYHKRDNATPLTTSSIANAIRWMLDRFIPEMLMRPLDSM